MHSFGAFRCSSLHLTPHKWLWNAECIIRKFADPLRKSSPYPIRILLLSCSSRQKYGVRNEKIFLPHFYRALQFRKNSPIALSSWSQRNGGAVCATFGAHNGVIDERVSSSQSGRMAIKITTRQLARMQSFGCDYLDVPCDAAAFRWRRVFHS